MKTILFQGDSITDSGRSHEDDSLLGYGYPKLVAANLEAGEPETYRFLNRGISGNRSIDLLARVKSDIINLKPDYMSILIGINDVWHELDFGNGIDSIRYELYYDLLIREVQEALPEIKIMIMEPFVLKGSATETHWNYFQREVEARAKASKRIAQKYALTFVPLQKEFEEALEIAPNDYWLIDGVHPTAPGHSVIKKAWLAAFRKWIE